MYVNNIAGRQTDSTAYPCSWSQTLKTSNGRMRVPEHGSKPYVPIQIHVSYSSLLASWTLGWSFSESVPVGVHRLYMYHIDILNNVLFNIYIIIRNQLYIYINIVFPILYFIRYTLYFQKLIRANCERALRHLSPLAPQLVEALRNPRDPF